MIILWYNQRIVPLDLGPLGYLWQINLLYYGDFNLLIQYDVAFDVFRC